MDHDPKEEHPAAKTAEELTEAAAADQDRARRLWRLQWAQAFRRLSELGGAGKPGDGRPH